MHKLILQLCLGSYYCFKIFKKVTSAGNTFLFAVDKPRQNWKIMVDSSEALNCIKWNYLNISFGSVQEYLINLIQPSILLPSGHVQSSDLEMPYFTARFSALMGITGKSSASALTTGILDFRSW